MNQAALLSVDLQLGTLHQQSFKTYLHHHPVCAAISKLNFSARRMALIHRSTFMKKMGKDKLCYLLAYMQSHVYYNLHRVSGLALVSVSLRLV